MSYEWSVDKGDRLMPANMAILAEDKTATTGRPKGAIVDVLESDVPWGEKVTLPTFIRLTIVDAEPDQVRDYLKAFRQVFDFAVLENNASDYVVRIAISTQDEDGGTVDPAKVADLVGGVKAEMWAWMQEGYSATLVSNANAPISYDIRLPKPIDLQEAKRAFLDVFAQQYPDRFVFSEVAVDQTVAEPYLGVRSVGRVQAKASIVDRLA